MNNVLWPPSQSGFDPATLAWTPWGRWSGVMTPQVARSLPSIARGIQLISGQVKQMPLDDYQGSALMPRPLLLERPDPTRSLAWFLTQQIDDYLLNGNAVFYVTSRDAKTGWPTSGMWVPAQWINMAADPVTGEADYYLMGQKLERDNVVHVQRGADPNFPHRGIGIVEQHFDALGVVRDQHYYEAQTLQNGAVPSVAIVTDNGRLSQEQAEAAADSWMEKYAGPDRRPAILPKGTVVTPLAWSPTDQQMVEARKLSLIDVANLLNMDSWWMNAPGGTYNYKTPGPMYWKLLKETIGPIVVEFEQEWSMAWLPRGHKVRFDRTALLMDEPTTMVNVAALAYKSELVTLEEAREKWLGLPADRPEGTVFKPPPTQGVESTDAGDATVPPEVDEEVPE